MRVDRNLLPLLLIHAPCHNYIAHVFEKAGTMFVFTFDTDILLVHIKSGDAHVPFEIIQPVVDFVYTLFG